MEAVEGNVRLFTSSPAVVISPHKFTWIQCYTVANTYS